MILSFYPKERLSTFPFEMFSCQVQVAPNFQYPRLSEARIVISNNTVPSGSRADEGIETHCGIPDNQDSVQALRLTDTTSS